MQALLAQLVQAQADAQKAQQAQAQQLMQVQKEAQEAQLAQAKQLEAALAQLASFQKQQTEQVEKTSQLSLARTTAGAVPLLRGQANTIEAHRWGITMETWFATAGVADADKVRIATSGFKESAQAWWASEQQAAALPGGKAAPHTWPLLLAAVKKQFLPMDVERWARTELEALIRKKHADVLDYTARYKELNQLVQKREEADRLFGYVNGLPEALQMKCAENKYATLADATEAAVRWHNARQSAKAQMTGVAGLNAVDGMGPSDSETRSQASSSSSLPQYGEGRSSFPQPGAAAVHNVNAGPQYVSSLEEQVARLTQTVMTWQQRGGGGGGRRGRERGGRGGSRGSSRDRSTSRTPIWERLKISKDTYFDRMKNDQCWQCGAANHRIADCPQKQSN